MLSLALEQKLHEFEAQWAAGEPPSVEEYLQDVGADSRVEMLSELVMIDAEFRLQATGDPEAVPSLLEEYFQKFPELRSDPTLAGPFADRSCRPDADACADQSR